MADKKKHIDFNDMYNNLSVLVKMILMMIKMLHETFIIFVETFVISLNDRRLYICSKQNHLKM